jgi:hypothetical protein
MYYFSQGVVMGDKFHSRPERFGAGFNCGLILSVLVCFVVSSTCRAVTSKITRHSSGADLLKGETKDVVVGSQGTIQLGRASETLVDGFKENVWSINSIVVSGGAVYLGTSPNGGIFKYSLGKLTRIYPSELERGGQQQKRAPEDVNQVAADSVRDANTVKTERYLTNEHIFAMSSDISGRLLAGISGERCSLHRLEAGRMEMIFEPNDAKYIFAIVTDDTGNIYLGTGPKGKVYKLNPFGKESQLIYESSDKNILSLAIGQDGFVYAGSDSRGLIYKIDPRSKTASVLYDSDQTEITAMLFIADGNLYATATSAQVVQTQAEFAGQPPLPGRPEAQPEKEEDSEESEGGQKLQIANTKQGPAEKPPQVPPPERKRGKPAEASYLYRITKDGYVTNIFSEAAVFFCLAKQQEKLLVSTGNTARLFSVEPVSEEQAVIYEDQHASQITAVIVDGEDVYLGTANPAKLIKMGKSFASEGTYTSELIDASQPAKWGKLQIEADIPQGCKVMVACRSGNVKDVNAPTFSQWTEAVEVTGPIQLLCPLGRFCQYKLVLQSEDGQKSPTVREVAVAHTIPNLAPKVESVSVERIEAPGKTGVFKISYKAKDENDDKLIYKIDFRKTGWTNWIELEDQLEADSFEWDGKAVEDGRYEVRVTASDERSNTTTTKLTGSRVSEPVVIDNTGPVVKEYSIDSSAGVVTLNLEMFDELSAIGQVDYTVDSNAEWVGTIPNDLVYDTTDEKFTIVIKDLKAGEHIISVKTSDAVGNTTYKTFKVSVSR